MGRVQAAHGVLLGPLPYEEGAQGIHEPLGWR